MISKERLAAACQLIKRKSFAVCLGLAPIMLLIAFLFNFKFGCNVIVDGKIIGTAKSRDCVYNLIESINEDFAPYFDGNDTITVTPVTTPKFVFKGRFTSEDKLAEALKATCPYLRKAYSIKSNGTTVVAFHSKSERDKAYEFISQYADLSNKASYTVLDDVTFSYESVPYGMIKSGTGAQKMLSRTYSVNESVEVDVDTALKDILLKYNMSSEEFSQLNPDYKENIKTKINVSAEIPYIRIMTNTQLTEKEVIKYRTRSVNDDTMYEDETKLKSPGTNGIKSIHKSIYTVNGKTLCEFVTDSGSVDAVDEVLLVGTKKYSKGRATGDFSSPYTGNLSSRFGARGGRTHKGIDVTGTVGDPITAADGGEVIYADWEDGYGQVVKIDHKNGYTTFYAHCNELYVAVGDKVAKGQKIAALGNTGRSTGPHLHFEIRNTENGAALDPLEYVEEETVQK